MENVSPLRAARNLLGYQYRKGIVTPLKEEERVLLSKEELTSLVLGKTIVDAKKAIPSFYHFHDSSKMLLLLYDPTRLVVKLDNNNLITSVDIG